MYLGHIVEQCPKDELYERPLHPYTKGLLEAISLTPGQDEHRYRLQGDALRRDVQDLGCRLQPRCHFAQPRCADEQQELQELAPGHWVRCWRAAELAGASPEVLS
jgi:oligopeptide/dipeptide ABC transporter ATP-binding protein